MMKYLRSFYSLLKNIPSGILAVGFTTLLVAISSTAVYAITPFFLRDTLGISLVTIGFIEASTESLSQVIRLLSGVISDKLKKHKPMFLLGTVFSFLAKPLMIFANGSALVLTSKIFDRLGNGFSATPRDAYVALHSTPDTKGSNIGLTMTFKTIGCVIGPFLVAICVAMFTNVSWRGLMCFTALPAVLAIFICQKYMSEKKHSDVFMKKHEFKLKDIQSLSRKFWMFLPIMFAFMLARTPECYLSLNLRDSGLPEWFCAGSIGFFNLVSVLISYPVGRLFDKYNKINVLMIPFIALAIAVFCFTTQSVAGGIVGVIMWGIQRAAAQIVSVSYVALIVDKKVIGTAIGLLNIIGGVASLIAVWIMGSLASQYNIAFAYLSSFGFSLVALILLGLFKIKNKTSNSSESVEN